MKYILGILFLVICTNYTYCADPLIELEPMPTLTEFQTYEDSEAWFYNQMLEYYKTAAVYSFQIEYLGAKPNTKVLKPNFDDLESLEFKKLKKYYKNAEALRVQLLALPEGEGNQKISELKQKISKLESKNRVLSDSNFVLQINADNADFYKSRYQESLKQIDSFRIELTDNLNRHNSELIEMNRQLLRADNNKYSIVSLGLFGTQHYFGNSKVQELLSPGVSLTINPGKVFGIGRILEFWTDYSYLLNNVNDAYNNTLSNGVHKISAGLSYRIELQDLMRTDDYKLHFNVGLGYFYNFSESVNTNYATNNSFGNTVKLELGFENFSRYFPLEIFIQVDFNKFNKDLKMLNTVIVSDNSWLTNYSIGIKLPLWQSIGYLN